MCSGGGSRPSTPKFNDPRRTDPEYLAVAEQLGFRNKKGEVKIKNQKQLYEVDKILLQRKEDEFRQNIADTEAKNDANRQADLARADAQYQQTMTIQQQQYTESMAAQEKALQAQLAAQAELQKRAEESALRSQVPQMTANASNARRVRSKTTGKQRARSASMGASQLRIPLGISSQMTGGSPVKLNIGS